MEIKTTTAVLGTIELVSDLSAELPIEGDFTIPDYQPEIWKIVRTKAEPVILGRLAVKNKATVEGYVKLTVFYNSSAGGELNSLTQRIPFSRQFELKGSVSESCLVSAGATVSYLNCRAVNERRLDARGALAISLTVPSFASFEAKSSASGEGVWQKTDTVGWTRLCTTVSKQFSVEERLSVDGNDALGATVIRSEATAVVDGVECAEGRAEVRGTVNLLAALESGADNGFTIKRAIYKIPFIQLIDCETVKPSAEVTVRAAAVSCTVSGEVNAEGMLEASVGCELELGVYESGSTEILSDAFSTRYETETLCDSLSVAETTEKIRQSFSVNEGFDMPEGRLADWFVSNAAATLSRNGDGYEAKVSALACFVAVDSEGSAFGFDKPFEITLPVRCVSPTAILLDAQCVFSHLDCVEAGGRLSFKAEGELTGIVAGIRTVSAVKEIKADEGKPKPRADRAISAYYASEGESVWDIARDFNTSPDGIFEENALLDKTLSEPRVLLVPIVE